MRHGIAVTNKLPRSKEIIKAHAGLWFFGGAFGGIVSFLLSHRDAAIGWLWFVTSNLICWLWAVVRIDKLITNKLEIARAREEETALPDGWRKYRLSVEATATDTLIARFNTNEWQDLNDFLKGLRSGLKPGYRTWKERGWSQDRWRKVTSEMYRLGFLELRGNDTRTGYRVTRQGWEVVAKWRPTPLSYDYRV